MSTIDSKVNINTAREMLDHEDERTTLKYYCFDRTPDDEREKQFEEAFSRRKAVPEEKKTHKYYLFYHYMSTLVMIVSLSIKKL